MTARRLTATALVLAAATLTLTACGPDEAGSPSAAGSAAPSVSAAPSTPASPTASATTGSSRPASPSAKPTGTAKPTSTAKPTADCTVAAHNAIGRVVESVDNAYRVHIWMKAKETKFVCGPDVPNDGYFEGYGDPAVFTFSDDAKYLLFADMKPTPVSLEVFMKHMEDCRNNPSEVQRPYSCYGGFYAISTSGGNSNNITSISELFHP